MTNKTKDSRAVLERLRLAADTARENGTTWVSARDLTAALDRADKFEVMSDNIFDTYEEMIKQRDIALDRAEKAETERDYNRRDADHLRTAIDRMNASLAVDDSLMDTAYLTGHKKGWNEAVEAAYDRLNHSILGRRGRLERWGQHLSDTKTPSISYAIEKADLDARVSCRDQIANLKKGDST